MTTVSGAEGMFRILTKAFPAEQSAPLDGLPIYDLGSLGGARDRELTAHQILSRGRGARSQGGVTEHAFEGARPRRGVERRYEQAGFPGIDDLRIPPGSRRDHRHAERERLEQRLRQ